MFKIHHLRAQQQNPANGQDPFEAPDPGATELTPTMPTRPLPPLLPLSDPGPRLLHSTFALHRATHLLTSKNLESEPLPHPLPPSLHPPPPVDMTEFDLDFILGGANAEAMNGLGRSVPVTMESGRDQTDVVAGDTIAAHRPPATTTLKLGPGGDTEDTFANFVGAFDEEYDDRRGGWTFRMVSDKQKQQSKDKRHSSLSPASSFSTGNGGSTEWASPKAGSFLVDPDGSIKSKITGCDWVIHKSGAREFDICAVTNDEPGLRFVLGSKAVHQSSGGVKSSSLRTSQPTVVNKGFTVSRPGGGGDSERLPPESVATHRDASSSSVSKPSPSTTTTGTFSGPKSLETSIGSLIQTTSKEWQKWDRQLIGGIKRTLRSGMGKRENEANAEKGLIVGGKRRDKTLQEQPPLTSRSWSGASSVQSNSWSKNSVTQSQTTADCSVSKRSESGHHHAGNEWGAIGDQERDSPRGGRGWEGVPEDAIAMVLPFAQDSIQSVPTLTMASVPDSLLIYFVPFTSTSPPPVNTQATTDIKSPQTDTAVRRMSLSQRLRRKKSKTRISSQQETALEASDQQPRGAQLVPLPFRSFRVVARVIETSLLKSEATGQDYEEKSHPGSEQASIFPISETGASATSVAGGTHFPTVIAVCHSRAQGVEFVLEGLDRLGLCEGHSAWGPTGYEEWRGSGLSEFGKSVVDVTWAACVAVLGLGARITP